MVALFVVLGALGLSVVFAGRQMRALKNLASVRVTYQPVAITAEGSQIVGRLDDGRTVIVNGHDRAWLRSRLGEERPDGDFSVVRMSDDDWSCVLRYDDGSDPALAVVDPEVHAPSPGPGGPA